MTRRVGRMWRSMDKLAYGEAQDELYVTVEHLDLMVLKQVSYNTPSRELSLQTRDLRSFEIRFEIESDDSDSKVTG